MIFGSKGHVFIYMQVLLWVCAYIKTTSTDTEDAVLVTPTRSNSDIAFFLVFGDTAVELM